MRLSRLAAFLIGLGSMERCCSFLKPVQTGISKLNMHLHHDHSHDHAHDHSHIETIKTLPARTFDSLKLLWRDSRDPKALRSMMRSSQAKVLLVSSVFFIGSMLVRKRFHQLDVVVFLALSSTLSVFNSLKSSAKLWMSRMALFKDGILKHSTPINSHYFFNNRNIEDRVTLLGVAVNIVLSAVKLFGGIAFNSAVLVADAGHSLSDLLSDFITLWAVQIARLPADEDHPYGHGKFESVGSLFLSLTLIATGIAVGAWSYDKMIDVLINPVVKANVSPALHNAMKSQHAQILVRAGHTITKAPSWPAMCLAGLSIVSKEWLFRVTKRVGDSLNSQILIANAWHHRSDAFSSVLSLLSIAAAISLPGLLILDSAAGIFIAGMICITGLEVLAQSIKQLTDSSDGLLVQQMSSLVQSVDGVQGVKNIRARSVGSGSIVDLTVMTEVKLSASAAHAIAERTKWRLLEQFPNQLLDVLVRTQSVGTLCPLLSRNQRSVSEIERDVRDKLKKYEEKSKCLKAIKRITVHYINSSALCVEVLITIDNTATPIERAQKTAQDIRRELVSSIADIVQVEVQLDLTEDPSDIIYTL